MLQRGGDSTSDKPCANNITVRIVPVCDKERARAEKEICFKLMVEWATQIDNNFKTIPEHKRE